MHRVSLLASDAFSVDPEGQNVLVFQRAALELLEYLLGPLLKPAAHRGLAEAKPIGKLTGHLLVIALRDAQHEGLQQLLPNPRSLHRLVALQRLFLSGVSVSNARHVDRDLLAVDSYRAGIGASPAEAVPAVFAAVTLSSEVLDLFLKKLLRQKKSHVRVMLNQVKLRFRRTIERAPERFSGWRLFGVDAMLRIHNRGYSSVKGCLPMCTGEELLLCSGFQLRLNIHHGVGFHAIAEQRIGELLPLTQSGLTSRSENDAQALRCVSATASEPDQ